jgi:hypothetical protein
MSQPQIIKYTPKNLYSNYSLLTISDIVSEDENNTKQSQQNMITMEPPKLNITTAPFKISQRKVLRSSKR